MHPLVARQMRKLGLGGAATGPSTEQWGRFVEVVSRTYGSFDEDRARLERSLDVSSKEMLERTQEIKHQALHDKLTGLPNRALLLDRIGYALAKARRHHLGTAVIFIDLDNFKLINDSKGHDEGDALLRAVADRLVHAVRPGDTVARLGGDEFVVLIEELEKPGHAESIARKILTRFEKPIQLPHSEAFASGTLGIAFTLDPDMQAATLIKNADTAMYEAEAKGKACYALFDERMNDNVVDRLELETSLRKALDHHEILIHYQPLIDIRSGTVLGAEALARWQHPTRGLVGPGTFVPIAEETGVIIPIGYWVLEQACRQMQDWSSDLALSVNMSGKQLQRQDVVDRVRRVLEETGFDPNRLKLEITESVLMADRADIAAKLRALKDIGITLALDDFGTGYSSLSTLRSFPIDTLKIDKAFVSRLEDEDEARAIVEAILALSKTMKLSVTGEGVETEFQRAMLQKLGCDLGQGYLFGRPMAPEEFARLVDLAKGGALDDAA